jgi:hypothetical protein
MQKFWDVVQDRAGNAIANASVTVLLAAGGTPTLYAANGTSPYASNVLLTDANGIYSFYAANGTYNISVAMAGYVTTPHTALALYDAADAAVAGLGLVTVTTVNKVVITAPAAGSTLTLADGKTFAVNNTVTLAGTDGTTLTGPGQSGALGYINLPQNSQSGAYTTVLLDQGKHILHPAADTSARTFTIDSNANVAYPIGTAITFVNQNAAGVVTIAITADTMRLAGAGTTGNRTLAANGVATALKITTTEWIISGTGLT